MHYVTVKVQFETSFTYEVEDEDYEADHNDLSYSTMEDNLVEDTIETLADLSNQYWRDATFEVEEVYPNGDTIRENKDGRPQCIACGYEWSAMLGEDEVPAKCACQITVNDL